MTWPDEREKVVLLSGSDSEKVVKAVININLHWGEPPASKPNHAPFWQALLVIGVGWFLVWCYFQLAIRYF